MGPGGREIAISHGLFDFTEIWYDGTLWVLVNTVENDQHKNNCSDGQPQVAVQHQLTPFIVIHSLAFVYTVVLFG